MTLQRNIYGIAMPLRQLMERDMVLSTVGDPAFASALVSLKWISPVRPQSMPPLPGQARTSDIHMDILTGKDESLDIADAFLPGPPPSPLTLSGSDDRGHTDRDVAVGTNEGEFHSAMEKRLKL